MAPAKPPVHPQHRRERTRDEPQVIELAMNEPVGHTRPDQPAVGCIGEHADLEQSISTIPEPIHNRATIANPAAIAAAAFITQTATPFTVLRFSRLSPVDNRLFKTNPIAPNQGIGRV